MVSQARYEAIIDSLHAALETLDTTEYRWGAEETWTRDFYVNVQQRAHTHLAAGVTLGEILLWANDRVLQDAAVSFAFRFNSGDPDSMNQARLQACQHAVMLLLTTWAHGDVRSYPQTTLIEPLTEGLEWLAVTCQFQLHASR